jgi:hypothetical protein
LMLATVIFFEKKGIWQCIKEHIWRRFATWLLCSKPCQTCPLSWPISFSILWYHQFGKISQQIKNISWLYIRKQKKWPNYFIKTPKKSIKKML